MTRPRQEDAITWTFLTNHAHVLICLAQDPEATMRAVAERVGITERAVQRIVAELEEGDCLDHRRIGRNNRYLVKGRVALRHPLEAHRKVGDLITLLRNKASR